MSMSDLELLQLVDTVKEKQRGPKGATGVGIEKIEQFDATAFTIRLTDGSFKRIDLPTPADGEVGSIGPVGPRGETGSTGRAGRDGSQGTPGRDGADGLPGSSIETAVVNSNGHLLLGISDGAIIDVGRVVGPAGATGSVGATGLAGESGKDGAAVLSGPRAPQADDGLEGDHWIDISSAEFSFFKKNGEGWNKLAELRQVPRDLRVPTSGTGGGGGGGNGTLQDTRTLPLVNGGSTIRKQAQARGLPPVPGEMATQEDANLYFLACLQNEDVIVSDTVPRPPYQVGQLWFSTNPEELTLYVFDGAVWVPAAPPVSLDGIEASIANVDAELLKVNANIAMNKRELDEAVLDVREDQERQDHQILELEEEIEALAPTFDRGEWAFVTEQPAAGQYAIGHLATSEYCLDIVGKCYAEADDDVAKSQCNRMALECETAEEAGESYLSNSWGGVDTLKIHKLDAKGKEHGFGDWTVGKYVELFNHDDEGYGLFVIDEAAVIEADVATFKVHHVAHEGKPAGVARAKVFEMSSADPTDYVRKTGDTITGTLKIEPTAGITSLTVKSNPELGNTSNIVDVYNNNGDQIFWVDSLRAGYTSKTARPSTGYHLTDKRYVDEAIAAELTAPARFEWKVYVNADGTPQQGSANLNGASMSDTSVIRLHKHALNAPVPIKGHGSGLTMYKHSPSPKLYYSTILSAWSKSGAEWQWKGTAEIDEIKLFSDYIQIKLGYRKESNMNFSNTGYYRFTVGGLF